MKKEQSRQGDQLLRKIDKLPDNLGEQIQDKGGMVIIAYGEATGHTHTFPSRDVVAYRNAMNVAAGVGVITAYLHVIRDTLLKHQEHGAILTRAGYYEVRQQREYAPEEIRYVTD